MAKGSTTTLYKLQSLMAAAIMRPLHGDDMQQTWIDGSSMSDYAAKFIKPNKQLSSFERLELYNRQYWYRLLESLQDDFPGVNALLGHRRFEALTIAYLLKHPSRSFYLNHLGKYLPDFIREESVLTGIDQQAAYDIASLEYAEIKAFDAASKEVLRPESFKMLSPEKIILQTQPYLSVLESNYAVDNFLLQLNKAHDQSVESNAVSDRTVRFDQSITPKKQRIYLAIHRQNNTIYYKRLDKDQFLLLKSLMSGKSLAGACSELFSTKKDIKDQEKLALKVNKSFAIWMELGWFCQ